MKIKHIAIAVITVTLLLTGCSEEHKAQSVVEAFLDSNLNDKGYTVEEYSKLDSTFFVSDSMINVMRNNADKIGTFKRIKFADDKNKTEKLLFIHVKYMLNGKTWKQTFYMDENLKDVVSFKND